MISEGSCDTYPSIHSSFHSSFYNMLWKRMREPSLPSGYNKAISIWYRETSSLQTASGQSRTHKSPLIHTKRLRTHCPSGTDFGSPKCDEKVRLSWKINYLIILSQNPFRSLTEGEVKEYLFSKTGICFFSDTDIFLCVLFYRNISQEVYLITSYIINYLIVFT